MGEITTEDPLDKTPTSTHKWRLNNSHTLSKGLSLRPAWAPMSSPQPPK